MTNPNNTAALGTNPAKLNSLTEALVVAGHAAKQQVAMTHSCTHLNRAAEHDQRPLWRFASSDE